MKLATIRDNVSITFLSMGSSYICKIEWIQSEGRMGIRLVNTRRVGNEIL